VRRLWRWLWTYAQPVEAKQTHGEWIIAFFVVPALLVLMLALCGCGVTRAATATERLATSIEQQVVPAVVALAQSGQRTTDALGDFWDWLKRQAAWAGWAALLSTWPYRFVRGLFKRRAAKAPKLLGLTRKRRAKKP
jgi:hypothetical protein